MSLTPDEDVLDFLQGYIAHKKPPPPLGPPTEIRHGPTVGSFGVAVSSEVPLYMYFYTQRQSLWNPPTPTGVGVFLWVEEL